MILERGFRLRWKFKGFSYETDPNDRIYNFSRSMIDEKKYKFEVRKKYARVKLKKRFFDEKTSEKDVTFFYCFIFRYFAHLWHDHSNDSLAA